MNNENFLGRIINKETKIIEKHVSSFSTEFLKNNKTKYVFYKKIENVEGLLPHEMEELILEKENEAIVIFTQGDVLFLISKLEKDQLKDFFNLIYDQMSKRKGIAAIVTYDGSEITSENNSYEEGIRQILIAENGFACNYEKIKINVLDKELLVRNINKAKGKLKLRNRISLEIPHLFFELEGEFGACFAISEKFFTVYQDENYDNLCITDEFGTVLKEFDFENLLENQEEFVKELKEFAEKTEKANKLKALIENKYGEFEKVAAHFNLDPFEKEYFKNFFKRCESEGAIILEEGEIGRYVESYFLDEGNYFDKKIINEKEATVLYQILHEYFISFKKEKKIFHTDIEENVYDVEKLMKKDSF